MQLSTIPLPPTGPKQAPGFPRERERDVNAHRTVTRTWQLLLLSHESCSSEAVVARSRYLTYLTYLALGRVHTSLGLPTLGNTTPSAVPHKAEQPTDSPPPPLSPDWSFIDTLAGVGATEDT